MHKLDNETEMKQLWRLGTARDNLILDITWDQIADILNEDWQKEPKITGKTYYNKYVLAKQLFEDGLFTTESGKSSASDLEEQIFEIKKERQKLSDERAALNKKAREQARLEDNFAILEKAIAENAKNVLTFDDEYIGFGRENDLIICLSDLHLGLDVSSNFGEYNTEIAKSKLSKYFEEIKKIGCIHKSQNAYVLLMGDEISGSIHNTLRLENRENTITQTQLAAQLISSFVYELSKYFAKVFVNNVAGNHSRIGKKDDVLRNERLDNIIPWYMKAKLSAIENIEFLDDENIDPTIADFEIRGKNYLSLHGDFDQFNEAGVSKLVMMLGYKPEAIFYGHLHHCSFDSISDVKIIRSGCFSGSIDDFSISKRLSGKPSQMVCVASKNGIEAMHPVML